MDETATRRKKINPKLKAAGWSIVPSSKILRPQWGQQTKKVFERDNLNKRKFKLAEYIEMMIICHNISCTCYDSTIDKLIVVWVGFYQVETIIWINMNNKGGIGYRINNGFTKFCTEKMGKYFSILKQNICSHTQCVLTIEKRLPYRKKSTMRRETLNKAIGVEYDTHDKDLFGLFLGFLFSQPLMKVHLVNFIKALLADVTLLPCFFKQRIHLFGVELIEYVLQLLISLLGLVEGKHLKQMQLGGVQYSWFHN